MKKVLLATIAVFACCFAQAEYLNWQLLPPLADGGYALDVLSSSSGADASADLSRPADSLLCSFYVELVDWEGVSGPAELNHTLTPTFASNVWHGSGYAAAPEPTGGLLIAIGLGLIALRRRREVWA